MIGILVYGNNHWIVDGPCPSEAEARELARRWSIIHIGGSLAVEGWQIRTRAFREDLEWAVDLEIGQQHSEAVEQLLGELAARGVSTRTYAA